MRSKTAWPPVWGKKAALCAALVLLAGALALCWAYGLRHEPPLTPVNPEAPIAEEELDADFPRLAVTRADQDTDPDGAVPVDLSQEKEELLITSGGKYRLFGKLNGRIRVSAEEQTVHLILDGATVLSGEGPALWAESTGKLILTLAEGTENAITDSGRYQRYLEDGVESCVFARGDLTVNGAGKLAVTGLYKDALRSSNVVKIVGGEITIRCKRTGIHGTDGIRVSGGSISLSTEKNGFRTTKSGADGRGNIVVSGGDHQVIAGRCAFLTARGDLYIYNCTIRDTSVVATHNVGGKVSIQSGCIQ